MLNPNDYEFDSTFAIDSAGGSYIEYFRAAQNAEITNSGSGNACVGTFLALEIDVPSGYYFVPGGSSSQTKLWKCASDSLTQLASTWLGVNNQMVMRVVATSTGIRRERSRPINARA